MVGIGYVMWHVLAGGRWVLVAQVQEQLCGRSRRCGDGRLLSHLLCLIPQSSVGFVETVAEEGFAIPLVPSRARAVGVAFAGLSFLQAA